MELHDAASAALTLNEQIDIWRENQDISVDHLWSINIASAPPKLVIVKKDLKNVPRNSLYGFTYKSPSSGGH